MAKKRKRHLCVEAIVDSVNGDDVTVRTHLGLITIEEYRDKFVVYKGYPLEQDQFVEVHFTKGGEVLVDDLRLEQISREEVMKIMWEEGALESPGIRYILIDHGIDVED